MTSARLSRPLAWPDPWPLLVLFVFTIPWEKAVWVPSIGSIAHLAGLAAFAVGIPDALRRRHALRRANAALLLAAAFVLWSGATWFWSVDRGATRARLLTFTELLAMLWLIWEHCRGPVRQAQLVGAYVCGAAAASSMAFWRYLHHSQTSYRRYAAPGFDPNDFGLVLALAIPPALWLALRARGWARWAWFAALAVILEAVLLTASRTAMTAAWVALLFAVWTWRRGDWPYRGATIVIAAGLGLSLVRFGPAPQRQRLATMPAEIASGTLHDRTRIWKAGLRVLRRRPLRGVGSGAYPKAVEPWLGKPKVAGFQYVAHNTFLSVLVESGAIGMAVFALLAGVLGFFVWSMPPPERALWAVAALVWAVGVSTLTWEHHKATWLLMALIMTEWSRAPWRLRKPA